MTNTDGPIGLMGPIRGPIGPMRLIRLIRILALVRARLDAFTRPKHIESAVTGRLQHLRGRHPRPIRHWESPQRENFSAFSLLIANPPGNAARWEFPESPALTRAGRTSDLLAPGFWLLTPLPERLETRPILLYCTYQPVFFILLL
jgi:hypothetical protein